MGFAAVRGASKDDRMASIHPLRHAAADDPCAALIAGAHARGLFDAFAMMGQGAILLDPQGRALAATAEARRRFGATLALTQGRLRAADPADDARLQQAILDSLAGRARAVDIGAPGAALTLRLTPMQPDPAQLLAVIVLLDPPREDAETPGPRPFFALRPEGATH